MHRKIRTVLAPCFIQLLALASFAQVEKFDIVTYTTPKGWGMEKGTDTLQFTKEDKANKTFAIVTVYRSMDAGPDSRANFLDLFCLCVAADAAELYVDNAACSDLDRLARVVG